MIPRPLIKAAVFVSVVGFAIGCARPTRGLAPPSATQTAESSSQIQKEAVRLSAGDTVVVSLEMETPGPEALSRQIAGDGTIVIWNGQQVRVAGLTPNEAASRIRLALVTNYIGIVFHKVNVLRVQPVRCNKCDSAASKNIECHIQYQ